MGRDLELRICGTMELGDYEEKLFHDRFEDL